MAQQPFGQSALGSLLDPFEPDTFYDSLPRELERMNVYGVDRRGPVSSLAWRARMKRLPHIDTTPDHGIEAMWFHGQRLRYDFRFRELAESTHRWLQAGVDDDLVGALRLLALSGQGEVPIARRVSRVAKHPTANRQTRQVLLHALWFSEDDEDALGLLDLAADVVEKGEDDSNVYFRCASALRRLDRPEAARREIDRAISALPPGENEVHQDYVRERELIGISEALAKRVTMSVTRIQSMEDQLAGDVKRSQDALEARVQEAEELVRDGLVRSMELLGLFLALTGFIVGTATAATSAETYWMLLLAMGFLLAGTFSLLLMMRWVTRGEKGRSK